MKSYFALIIVLFILFIEGCGGGSSNSSGEDESIPLLLTIPENSTVVTTVNMQGDAPLTYAVSSGEDRLLFTINAQTGKLKFNVAPNFENPSDANRDNLYKLTVESSDASDQIRKKEIEITVTDIDENRSDDSDGDYIPDNIEILINSDINSSDENNNSTIDGVDTEGGNGDTFFDMQWHIRSLGTITNESGIPSIIGNDLDLLETYHHYMGYNHGENIIVQVVDTGVDADHEDLEENMDLSRSYKGGNIGDPSGTNDHGTKVAGIMAARAFNGRGVRGIIPFAHIAGSDWLRFQSIDNLEKVWLSGAGANEIAVSNNSWGTDFDTDTDYEEIMALGASTLRNGKGRIYIFAAGNSREKYADANLQYVLNNRFAITVAALKHDNTYAEYSTPGSNILVSGYSGNDYKDSPTIGTTTIMGYSTNSGDIDTQTTWSEDLNENYTFTMNGTSAATPTVAASIALVMEACQDLTWRDIKYLTAVHAKRIDHSRNSWVENHAGHWHSVDYGFGLINAQGMIEECTSGYTGMGQEENITLYKEFNMTIADNNTSHLFELNTTENIKIEWVEVTIDNDNRYASDYRVELISPQDTKTILVKENTYADYRSWMNGGFRLSSAAFLDEDTIGSWKVQITDRVNHYSGTLKSIRIKIYGH